MSTGWKRLIILLAIVQVIEVGILVSLTRELIKLQVLVYQVGSISVYLLKYLDIMP